jgi:WD40 repeat protein
MQEANCFRPLRIFGLLLLFLLDPGLSAAPKAASPPDAYESLADDGPDTFNLVFLNQTQEHTFHSADDEDWMRFEVLREGLPHSIRIKQYGADVDVALEIHLFGEAPDCGSSSLCVDEEGAGLGSVETWTALNPPVGAHLVRVRNVGGLDDARYSIAFTGNWGEGLGIGNVTRLRATDAGFEIRRGGGAASAQFFRGAAQNPRGGVDAPSDVLYDRTKLVGPPGSLQEDLFITLTGPWDILNPLAIGDAGERPWVDPWLDKLGELEYPRTNATVTEILVSNASDASQPLPAEFDPPLRLTIELENDATAFDGMVLIDDIPGGSTPGKRNVETADFYLWNGAAWERVPATIATDNPGKLATLEIPAPTWVSYSGAVGEARAMIYAVVPTGEGEQPDPTEEPPPEVDPDPPLARPQDRNVRFSYQAGLVTSLAISPHRTSSGGYLLSAGQGGEVVVYDTVTGQIAREIPSRSMTIFASATSPDFKMVAISDVKRRFIEIFDLETATRLSYVDLGPPNWIALDMSWTPDSLKLMVNDANGGSDFVDPQTGLLIGPNLAGVSGDGNRDATAWKQDGSAFAYLTANKLYLRDGGSGEQIGAPASVIHIAATRVAFDRTETRLLAESYDPGQELAPPSAVQLFSLPGPALILSIPDCAGIAASPTRDEFVLFNIALGRIELRSTLAGGLLASLPRSINHHNIRAVFEPDGDAFHVFTAAGAQGVERIVVSRDGVGAATGLQGASSFPVEGVTEDAFFLSNERVGVVTSFGSVKVLSRTTSALLASLGESVVAGDADPAGAFVVAMESDGDVRVYETGDYQVVQEWNAPPALFEGLRWSSAAVSPDGTRAIGVTTLVPTGGHSPSNLLVFDSSSPTPIYSGALDNLVERGGTDISRDSQLYGLYGFKLGRFDGTPPISYGGGGGQFTISFSPVADELLIGDSVLDYSAFPAAPVGLGVSPTYGPASRYSTDGTKIVVGPAFGPELETNAVYRIHDATNRATPEFELFQGVDTKDVEYDAQAGLILSAGNLTGARLMEVSPARAIVVAGGGPYEGNGIAEQTDALGAYAYQVLKARGYRGRDIMYLSAFGERDADGDGVNDVDGPATIQELSDALRGDFARDAGRLLILMVDHGYATEDFMAFRLNPSQGILATTLDSWLDDLQASSDVDVSLVIDCCYAGRFVDACRLKTEGLETDPEEWVRVVISSTSGVAEAVFLPPPDLSSFMLTFLGAAYMGNSLGESFNIADAFFDAFGVAMQRPEIDDGGADGIDVAYEHFLGSSLTHGIQTTTNVEMFFPVFASTTPSGTQPASFQLAATLLPSVDAESVVATIRPPAPEVPSGEPIGALPVVNLLPQDPDRLIWRAEPAPELFDRPGAYTVAFVAKLPMGRLSDPKVATILIGEGFDPESVELRALIAVGEGSDAGSSAAFLGIAEFAERVYPKRFAPSDSQTPPPGTVRFMSPATDPPVGSTNIVDAIAAWGAELPEDGRLFLHFAGERAGFQRMRLSDGDALTATALGAALDDFQAAAPNADIVVVLDVPGAGEWLPVLSGPGRVLLLGSGADEEGLFIPFPPFTSFSQRFLSSCYQGHSLRVGYRAGRDFFGAFLPGETKPLLDDNGDGASTKLDGALAASLHLGKRYVFAGDAPSGLPFVLGARTSTPVAIPGRRTIFEVAALDGVEPRRVYATRLLPNGEVAQPPEVDLVWNSARKLWQTLPGIAAMELGRHSLLFYGEYGDGDEMKRSEPALALLTVVDGELDVSTGVVFF